MGSFVMFLGGSFLSVFWSVHIEYGYRSYLIEGNIDSTIDNSLIAAHKLLNFLLIFGLQSNQCFCEGRKEQEDIFSLHPPALLCN